MAETVSIPEASTLTGMSEGQIRRVVKSKKVVANLTNQGYLIEKESLFALYPQQVKEIKENDRFGNNHVTTHGIDIGKSFEILTNTIQQKNNELDDIRRLLDTSKEEKDRAKEAEWILIEKGRIEKEEIRERFLLELKKKDTRITFYKWCSLWLLIVLIISVLILKWFLLIKF